MRKRGRKNSQRTSFSANMKRELKSERALLTCAQIHTALSGHRYAREYQCLIWVRLIIQNKAGVISEMCYEAIVLGETQKDRCSAGAVRRLSAEQKKKKINVQSSD